MLIPTLGGAHPLVGAVDEGGGWLYNLLTEAGVSDHTAKTVTDLIVRPVAVLLVILVAVIVAHLGSKAVRRVLQRIADQAAARSGSQRTGARMSTMSALSANLWRFFVFVIAVAIILGMLGVDLTPLLASATIIGATLGFGAQLIIRDYLSGFLLTVEDQYGIGDTVTIGAVTGVVEDLTLPVTSASWPTRRVVGPMPWSTSLSPGPRPPCSPRRGRPLSGRRGGWPDPSHSRRTAASHRPWSRSSTPPRTRLPCGSP
jgi:hypothetical protein